jgi:hypothetical protein
MAIRLKRVYEPPDPDGGALFVGAALATWNPTGRPAVDGLAA